MRVARLRFNGTKTIRAEELFKSEYQFDWKALVTL
jgi:hypothetical protein